MTIDYIDLTFDDLNIFIEHNKQYMHDTEYDISFRDLNTNYQTSEGLSRTDLIKLRDSISEFLDLTEK